MKLGFLKSSYTKSRGLKYHHWLLLTPQEVSIRVLVDFEDIFFDDFLWNSGVLSFSCPLEDSASHPPSPARGSAPSLCSLLAMALVILVCYDFVFEILWFVTATRWC